jgi:hypothetical protein
MRKGSDRVPRIMEYPGYLHVERRSCRGRTSKTEDARETPAPPMFLLTVKSFARILAFEASALRFLPNPPCHFFTSFIFRRKG